jgi:hypothetical protein
MTDAPTAPSDPAANAAGPRPWTAATLWLAVLAPFFFVTYGLANTFTSHRAHVGSVAFAWERHIPFLAWTIVPYWSVDAFYGLSLFVCRTRQELSVHVRRLLAAQAICIAGFLAFPLRFSFPRPVAEGFYGAMFAVLTGFDKPFNQAPSLHITLLVILWVRFAAHLAAAGRVLLHAWFVLIALSVLTTYQHHFLDIPTGLWAGLFCLWLIPEAPPAPLESPAPPASPALPAFRSRDPKRFRFALAYLIAGGILGLLGIRLGGWGWLLLWPACALILVAAIYAAGDPGLFRKTAGRMSGAALALLLPYVAGAWLNSRLWTRRDAAPAPIADGVLLGRIPTRRELLAGDARSVVDLIAELPLPAAAAGAGAHTGYGIAYRAVPMLDLLIPTPEQVDAAVAAIDALAAERPTLLCCALGFGRSATVAAAWLVASGHAPDIDDAMATVRRARPGSVLTPAHRRHLLAWQTSRRLLDAG